MNRRAFLRALPLFTVATGRNAIGQSPRKPLKVGFFGSGGTNAEVQGASPASPSARALVQGLNDLGYRYGIDFVIEGRGGEGRPDRYAALARELIAAKVDVIVAAGPTVEALHRVTTSIPIVMVGGPFDPVEEKLVASLAAPGGNITGLTLQQVELVGKRMELLREAIPGQAAIGVLWEASSNVLWKATRSAAAARGWPLVAFEASNRSAIGPACASIKAAGAGSLLVVGGSVMFDNASQVVREAMVNRLAAMYPLRVYTENGGLMSYAADLADLYRRAASFVDRIAKGARPATIPMEQPTKFELVVNLNAARAIGVTIPQSIQLRADQVLTS